MTTPEQLARARKLLAGIKAEFEKGTPGKWESHEASVRHKDGTVVENHLCGYEFPIRQQQIANARNIAACHNAMPAALEAIGGMLDALDAYALKNIDGLLDIILEEIMPRLESMAREFGVEVEP